MEQHARAAPGVQLAAARGARRAPPLARGRRLLRPAPPARGRDVRGAPRRPVPVHRRPTSCTSTSTSRSRTCRSRPTALRDMIERTEAELAGLTPVWTGSNHDISRFPTRWADGDPDRARCAADAAAHAARHGVPLRGRRDRHDRRRRAARRARRPGRASASTRTRAATRCARRCSGRASPAAGSPTPASTPWLRFGDLACNVADQHDDPESFLTLTKDLIAYRHAQPDLRDGRVVGARRAGRRARLPRGATRTRCVLNLGDAEATVDRRRRRRSRSAPGGPATARRVAGSVTLAPERGRRSSAADPNRLAELRAERASVRARCGQAARLVRRRSRPGGRRAPRR